MTMCAAPLSTVAAQSANQDKIETKQRFIYLFSKNDYKAVENVL